MNLIEPTPQNVREEIEYVKDPELGMWLKDLLTFGARSVEFAGVNCKNEKAYGTVGVGHAWLDEYKPKVLTDDDILGLFTLYDPGVTYCGNDSALCDGDCDTCSYSEDYLEFEEDEE
jgi:hypothetical protein